MVQLRAYQYDLPLKHTFTISRGSIDVQPTLVVELTDGRVSGYGEATTNDYYGVTLTSMLDSLRSVRSSIEADSLEDPEQLWARVHAIIPHDPFTLCAIDQAAWDFWGKCQGHRLYHLWGLDPQQAPLSDYTIGIDSLDRMVAKMREFPEWPIYKIKLGTASDLEIIRRLRQETDAVFRVDANCAWTAEQTIENSLAMQELGVEFIEQPLPAEAWSEMARVYAQSALPVLADESCIIEEDVPRCAGFFHGVNIKLVKCGGLTAARRMIAAARQRGLRVMVGCMTESTVGISAIAQLAPLLDYVDMDGAMLLAEDIASGVTLEQGHCRYAQLPGSGVRLTKSSRDLLHA